jgi:hypothetical protein
VGHERQDLERVGEADPRELGCTGRRSANPLRPDVRRLDEALRYVEHVISNYPERGLPTAYPGVRVIPLVLADATGSLIPIKASLFYIFDDTVHVLSIKPAP